MYLSDNYKIILFSFHSLLLLIIFIQYWTSNNCRAGFKEKKIFSGEDSHLFEYSEFDIYKWYHFDDKTWQCRFVLSDSFFL